MEALSSMIGKLCGDMFSALMNQAPYAIVFRGELEAMKTHLELAMAFLADTKSLNKRGVVLKRVLEEMRDLIYEADDILTDCLVRDEYQLDKCCYKCPPTQLMFSRKTRYKLKDINYRLEKMEKNLATYLRPQQLRVHGGSFHRNLQLTVSNSDLLPTIGLDAGVKKIKEWILGTDGVLHRIAIVGMGGLGKTTIAQKVFQDNELSTYFDERIWVSVSQDFNVERIMRSILQQLGRDFNLGTDNYQMFGRTHQLLKDKSCLIVMDDVWENIDLDWWYWLCSAIHKPPAWKSSCAIITTRNADVGLKMGVDNSRIHWPQALNTEESWLLFSTYAFSRNEGRCPNELFKDVSCEIVKKCGGLPLALKTIGALLASKLDSYDEWKKVAVDFHELMSNVDSLTASLQLSYDALNPRLKLCLLSFGIYPEEVEILTEPLVYWWAAEGLVQSLEEGYDCVQELVGRNVIEVVHRGSYDGRVHICKMLDLLRVFLMRILEDESLCMFSDKGKQILTNRSRWLSCNNGMDFDPSTEKISPQLRAFLVMPSVVVPSEMLIQQNLSSLRVLVLSQTKLDRKSISVEDLFTWICSLERLACLNLSGILSLREVPPSIQKLRNLQFLILTGCSNLTKISPQVTYLKRLLVLGLSSCRIDFLPKGLDRLSNLQDLSGFRVVRQANRSSFQLSELQKLAKLNVLRMNISSESEISESEWHVLSELKELKVLSIDLENSRERKVMEMLNRLSPPPRLREMYLRRYRHEKLPEWVSPRQLSTLHYFSIEDGDISSIRMASRREESDPSWQIEGLCLKFLPNLVEDWLDLKQEMPLLHFVEVRQCPHLKNFPCSVRKPGIWRKREEQERSSEI